MDSLAFLQKQPAEYGVRKCGLFMEDSDTVSTVDVFEALVEPLVMTSPKFSYPPYHIRFLREDSITDALRSHPLDGQFDSSLLVLSEVILSYINTLRQSKVSNFDDKVNINPAYIKLIVRVEISCTNVLLGAFYK